MLRSEAGELLDALREDLASARRSLDRLESRIGAIESTLAENAATVAESSVDDAARLQGAGESFSTPFSSFGGGVDGAGLEPDLEDFSLPIDTGESADARTAPPMAAIDETPSDDDLAELLRQVSAPVRPDDAGVKDEPEDGHHPVPGAEENEQRTGRTRTGDRIDFSTDDLEHILDLGRG